MRKLFTKVALAAAMLVGIVQQAQAQTSAAPAGCGTHIYYKSLYGENPGLKQHDEAYETAIAEYLMNVDLDALERTRAGDRIIPVVFHIVHEYGGENIPTANVMDAMRILNEDFNKMNADTAGIVPEFRSRIGNAKIKFMLARKDPQGNCTDGIDRIYSYKTNRANDQSKLNSWSRNYYFNVWVTKTIGAQNVAGYAYKPQSLNGGFLNMYDGIIILHDYIGSLPPASVGFSRALTHEFGHSLGLDHTWGPTNDPNIECGDDGVSDTPPTEGHSQCIPNEVIGDSVCITRSPATPTSPIVASVPGPLENLQNFMEYSYCPHHMYTIGQCARMNQVSFVDNNASRNLLTGELAHQISGIFDTTVCPPSADFINRRYFTCVGTANVNLNGPTAGNSAGTDFKWIMPNSPQNNSILRNPTGVSFSTPGWQPLTLEVTGPGGMGSVSKNNKLYVSDPAATMPVNYTENFESAATSDRWPIFNFYENYFKWSIVNNGYLWGKCIKMNTYDDRPFVETFTGTPAGDADEFISPAYDLSSQVGATTNLSFVSAGATKTSAYSDVNDSLRIYYSINCGANWTQLAFATVNRDNLFNMLQANNNYEPQSTQDWIWRSYQLPEDAKTNATYFRFRYKSSDFSNNLYIDEISVGNWATAIGNNNAAKLQMSITPNPNSGAFTIRISKQTEATIDITDVTGKVVKTIAAAAFNGNGEVEVNMNMPSGVYFATARANGVNVGTQKFVVNN